MSAFPRQRTRYRRMAAICLLGEIAASGSGHAIVAAVYGSLNGLWLAKWLPRPDAHPAKARLPASGAVSKTAVRT
jgi:hypothetical protein